jgi:hypothetical protein
MWRACLPFRKGRISPGRSYCLSHGASTQETEVLMECTPPGYAGG